MEESPTGIQGKKKSPTVELDLEVIDLKHQ